MCFQAFNSKEKNFLEFNDNNNNTINSTYSKGESWLKHFGYSNTMCYKHQVELQLLSTLV